MMWRNLQRNICPKCNKDFFKGLETQIMQNSQKLFVHPCGFKIREMRFAQIVNNQVTQDLENKLNHEYEDTPDSVR